LSQQQPVNLDATLDVLQSRSFGALADALRTQRDEIMRHWSAMVVEMLPAADTLTFAQLQDHVPDILAQLAAALASTHPKQSNRLLEMTPVHGVTRFDQGFKFDEVVVEYRLLRRVIIERVEVELGRRTSLEEDIALNMGIDAALQHGLVAFVGHLTDRLRAAAEAEAKYLTFLSHDLRGTLNAVTLSLHLVKRRLAGSPEAAEDVADLTALERSILGTVAGMDRLLQVERMRSPGEAPAETTAVDLHAVAADAVRTFAAEAAKKGVRLAVDVPPGTLLETVSGWVTLLLQNLVGNAVKYSRTGTVRVRSAFQTDGTGGSGGGCLLAVSDEGPGIAPEQLGHVFQAFQRGETHGQPGTGLGLTIAARAARLLGGELRVTSQLGVGSEFSLIIPVPRRPVV
jgi:signal transduction histidine kinase